MPGKITFEIKGAREMENLLKQLGPRLASRVGDRALRAAAKPIVAEAKRLVPVKTGGLRRSITAVTSRKGARKDQRIILIGFRPPASRRAHFTEFGTVHSSPRPFMRPALDSQVRNALMQMELVLARGIASEAAGLRK